MILIEFLTARVEEDKEAALAAGGSEWTHNPDGMHGAIEDDDSGETVTYHEGSPTREQSIHIVRFSPARVLRDIEAKRAIIEEHRPRTDARDLRSDPCDAHDPITLESEPCDTLRHLAAVYRDHPDYREDWKPWPAC
jgi:hypothetical protein